MHAVAPKCRGSARTHTIRLLVCEAAAIKSTQPHGAPLTVALALAGDYAQGRSDLRPGAVAVMVALALALALALPTSPVRPPGPPSVYVAHPDFAPAVAEPDTLDPAAADVTQRAAGFD